MQPIPRGKVNALINRNEERVSTEVYDLYVFLKQHPLFSSAPSRFKDVLRASVSGTPFGFIFRGLVSVAAAEAIDQCLAAGKKADPCAGLHRDHFFSWRENAEFFLGQPLMDKAAFWAELKRRNEVALVTKAEHTRVSGLQRTYGHEAYSHADIRLVHVDPQAIKLAGYGTSLVRQHWPALADRQEASLPTR